MGLSNSSIRRVQKSFQNTGEINGTAYIVMVVYTERGEVTRIISARKATSQERRAYYG